LSYCTLDQVRSVLPAGVALNDAAAKPPLGADISAAGGWIDQISAEVNNALSNTSVTLPLDPTSDLYLAIQYHVIRKVAYDILVVRGVSGSDKPYWADWGTDYKQMLKDILAGTFAGTAGTPWSYTMDAATSQDTSLGPMIEKDQVF